MDPQIRAEAMQLLKFAEKYETFDIRDVRLLQPLYILDVVIADSSL